MNRHILRRYAASAFIAGIVAWCGQVLAGQAPGQAAGTLTVRAVSPQTGFTSFAGSSGQGVLLAMAPDAPASDRALAFIDGYGRPFGLADRSDVQFQRSSSPDELGIEHVRMQQVHRGVPVTGAEFIVHLQAARVTAANGRVFDGLPDDVSPAITAAAARDEVRGLIQKVRPDRVAELQLGEPRLEILDLRVFEPTALPARLCWFIEATAPDVRYYVWIDAKTGGVVKQFSQITEAKNRRIYTLNHATTGLPGTLVRSEGGPATGDADQDNAYTFSGLTYDYYLSAHGRDSFDGAGGMIISTTQFGMGYANAFWDGTQMVYGDGFASADDVVAHELTHGVTEHSANLFYYTQSGALNESFSDIFGETVDLTDGVGNDAPEQRWLIGEDLGGAIRSLMDPSMFGDPGRMSDAGFYCTTNAYNNDDNDNGGVHINSGIPNHAYALMVDGGTYNNISVTGIGLTKAAKIEYRALTAYLTSGSGFLDNYNALNQSCTDLIGTAGITAGDCAQVQAALQAVEMNATWACPGATAAPALCPTGAPTITMSDGFEAANALWTTSSTPASSVNWVRTTFAAKSGSYSHWGEDAGSSVSHNLTTTNAVMVPSGGRLYFDHLFEFENDGSHNWDGAVFEYSTTNGASWIDAGSLIDGGQAYNGTIASPAFGNPLGGQPGFVRTSRGYTGTRLNLSLLAGQSVKFRFRVGADVSVSSLGWHVDNFAIYTCLAFTDDPLQSGVTTIKPVHITELRQRIDELRARYGLSVFSWTDGGLGSGTGIKVQHIDELRSALLAAYPPAGQPSPPFTDPVLTAGTTPIKAIHLMEIRAAIAAIY